MGIQFRKRTKGKTSWFNVSASKKNGLGASFSFKPFKNVTITSKRVSTSGKSRAGKLTVNLGNGMRWVSYGKSAKKSTEYTSDPDVDLPPIISVTAICAFGFWLLIYHPMVFCVILLVYLYLKKKQNDDQSHSS